MKASIQIAALIDKYIRQEISQGEQISLDAWIAESDENKKLFEKLTNQQHQLKKLKNYEQFNKEHVWKNIQKEIPSNSVITLLSSKKMRYAAAILLPLMILSGIGIYFMADKPAASDIAQIDEFIKPGNQKAILILSDGEEVDLADNSVNIEEEGTVIENNNLTLQYTQKSTSRKRKAIRYNELHTPVGGTYNLKLADGTEVWLNAGSTLKFPVEFTDSVRKVYLQGEGYFKVTHNGSPFIVDMNSANVRVLGTSFNVSAYADDALITTTLVEGKVAFEAIDSLTKSGNKHILTPGLQANMQKVNRNINLNKVNTGNYTSWIDGKLEFNNEDLNMVMKKLARWYDFEYTFSNSEAKDYHFTARFNREDNISDILSMLELTTQVKFELENNTIVIL